MMGDDHGFACPWLCQLLDEPVAAVFVAIQGVLSRENPAAHTDEPVIIEVVHGVFHLARLTQVATQVVFVQRIAPMTRVSPMIATSFSRKWTLLFGALLDRILLMRPP